MKTAFYYVDEGYIDYLKAKEIQQRGFTTVPNVKYHSKEKFFYGIILKVNEISYFVPITHYSTQQENNILIKIEHNKKIEVSGSMRFNYMIPVPKQCLTLLDFNDTNQFSETERNKLRKEYKYCLKKLSSAQKKAKKTYEQVLDGKKEELIKNSCDFSILEEAYREYIEKFGTT